MKRGRQPHKPSEKDRKEVRILAGIGLTQEQICAVKGISRPTLAKYYSAELGAGWREVKHPETPPTIESMSDEQLEAILVEQLALQGAPPMKLIEGKKQKD